jgi:hypothetical protein
MIGIFHGRGITETARVFAQIDVDLRGHLHEFNNGRNSNSLAVFLCLALHANEGGWAWPGRDLIHKETGIGTGHALSNALAHLRKVEINGQRVFTHYRERTPDTKAWGRSAYLIFPDLKHAPPPLPNMEVWDPHAGDQHMGDHHAGNQHYKVEPSREEPSEEKDCAAKNAALSPSSSNDGSADWLKESRIEGESTLDQMSPEEQARVASPASPDPVPDPTAPEWENVMRKGLSRTNMPGDFTISDAVRYCQRFYDITSNPPPVNTSGNGNWRSGAVMTLDSFHGSLFTLYESRGQPLPPAKIQRRLFMLCVDLFFATGSGYEHITAGTPRALSSSMASLIGDLVDISNFFGLKDNCVLPNEGHIKNWLMTKDSAKKRKGKMPREPAKAEKKGGEAEPAFEPSELDQAAARRVLDRMISDGTLKGHGKLREASA